MNGTASKKGEKKMAIQLVFDNEMMAFIEVDEDKYEEQYMKFESNGYDEPSWKLYHTVKYLDREMVNEFVSKLVEAGFERI